MCALRVDTAHTPNQNPREQTFRVTDCLFGIKLFLAWLTQRGWLQGEWPLRVNYLKMVNRSLGDPGEVYGNEC